MVTAITNPDDYGRLGGTAFATPTEVLLEVWPTLSVSSPPYSLTAPFMVEPLPPDFVLTDDGLTATCAYVIESIGPGPGDRVAVSRWRKPSNG